uniref:Trinucleotide repeat containing adaptor 6Bb.2 n=1 Tax=Maylandia zebra TaxID=106582 RepID=A0A3P9BCR3_9CICH
MEDKKKKKEDKKKRETSQKVTGGSAQVPPGGGNNAKQRTAVANGQPSTSPSGSQTTQQQRYMSREVPPRFRCQQDHKVLLKRGQPPLSSMLLGGGEGGSGGLKSTAGGPPHLFPHREQITPMQTQLEHLGNPGQELGSGGAAREAGPNQEGGSEGDCGAASEGEGSSNLSGSTSSSSASSSWRSIPPVSTDLSAGASQADGWGGGGTGAQGQEGNVWGSGTPGNKTGWGRRNGGGSTTPVVSQGPWEGSSSDAEWGETAGSASSSNLAIASGRGEEGSSISSSAGSLGVVGSSLEDSSSPKFATMTKAWDNQKGIDTGDGAVMEWGGGTGGEGPSSSGGGSIAGSGGGGSGSEQKQEHSSSGHHHSHQTSNAEVALLSLLNRPDLDPKVLSNTGWGQTQIRQNVAWDLDTSSGVGNRNERNTSSSSAFSSATMNTTTTHIGEQGSGWKDGPENKGKGGWKGGGRGETSGWGGGDWRQRDSTPGGGWGDGRSRGGSNSDEGSSWGASDEGGSQRGGWGDGGGVKSHPDWGSTKPHTAAAQIPNSQATPMKAPNQQQHQSQGQQPPGGPIQGGWNSRPNVGGGGPPSKNQNQSSGWTSGPIPQISGGGSSDTLEPSGWEEPSPQSISRKMEIDDGTSAWGDPNRYNTKNVNLWDKNSAIPGQSHSQQAPPPSMQQQQPPRRQQGMQSSSTTPGNGAMGKKKLLFHSVSAKSIENWIGKGDSISASRHPSWDEEEDGGGGAWNSTGSQGSSSSFNSGGWGQTHGGKRGNMKVGKKDSRTHKRGGGGMSQPRGMHQPGMHSMNPSQGSRAQVPHPFLSAQVCFLLLLIMMNCVLFCLSANTQACQFLLQQQQQQQQQQQFLQNQRKFPQPQPLRQQPDPQQVSVHLTNPAGTRLLSWTVLHGIFVNRGFVFCCISSVITEFQPGVPWKGIQNSGDPESDPYMTPGSVLGSPGSPSLNDSDHQLLRDNIGPNPSLNTSLPSPGAWPYSASDSPLSNAHSTGKYSDYKPSWPPEPIGQNKLWKTSRNSSQLPRPPPGLTNQKQASPSPWGTGGPRLARSWGGGGINQESRFGQAWSDGAASRGSCWLLLSNLTPQIDGSTLRTICMQHGPLLTFHLGLTQGSALIRYSTRQEAAKAQGALHMCVLGNTTILAEFVSEEEVARYVAHSQAGGAEGATVGATSGGNGNGSGGESGAAVLAGVRSSGSGWQSLDGTGSSSESSSAQGPGLGIFSQWSTNGAGEGGGVGGVESGRSGLWGGMTAGYPSSSLWGAPQMEERHQMDSPAGLLPGDLLGGGTDSI